MRFRGGGRSVELATLLGRKLRRDETGFVLVFLAIAIPAILGLIGLALDGIRLTALDTDTARIADAAALAAADRLDRSPDAIPQARAAALALATATADRGNGRLRLAFRFAASLGDLRQSATSSLSDTAGPDARYVEVRVSGAALETSFLQLVGVHTSPLERRSVAESQYYACDVTPMMLCHADPAAFAAEARPGNQFLLRMDGNVGTGSIALLDRPDADGPRQALRNLASGAPNFCYADGLQLRRNIDPADYEDAVNVRFDHYRGRNGPVDPAIADDPPAPDIIQGKHLATCNSPPQGGDINPPYHLPRDSAYAGLNLTGFWNAGVGDWKITPPLGGTGLQTYNALDEYMVWNHADKGPDVLTRLRDAPTRYDLYLSELGLTRQTERTPVDTRGLGASVRTMPTGGPRNGPLSVDRENPAPVCYAGRQPPTDPQRRVIDLTVADCTAFPTAATAATLSRHVAKFFLTEPANLGLTLVEFIGMLNPRDDADKLRHVVQLVGGG